MKDKLITIGMVFLFLFMIPGLAQANTHETIEREAQATTNELGLELRSLQLERSIETRLVIMIETAQRLPDEELDENLALVNNVLEDVREDTLNKTSFVEYRVQAQEFVSAFRQRVNELNLSGEDRADIRGSVQDDIVELRQSYSERTRELATSYNRERAGDLAERAGVNPDEVRNQIRENMDRNDVAQLVRERLGEQRQQIAEERRAQRQQIAQEVREAAQQVRDRNMADRQERIEQISNVREAARNIRDRMGSDREERPGERDRPRPNLEFEGIDYEYDGSVFTYEAVVISPNTCFELDSQSIADRSMTPTLRIAIVSEQVHTECQDVLTRLATSERIEISNLQRVLVSLDGEQVYRSDLDEPTLPRPDSADRPSDEEDTGAGDADEGVANRERSQIREAAATFRNGVLTVSGQAQLPTDCHRITVENNLGSGELLVYQHADGDICRDIVRLEDFSQTREMDEAPQTVRVNNVEVEVKTEASGGEVR